MFFIDERILSSCFTLSDWSLSRVFLKNERSYPWFILVPKKEDIQEIYQLTIQERQTLMEEVNRLSCLIKDYFKPDKLNIGALGNIVPQLHMHVVARYKMDHLWPHGIWQASVQSMPYEKKELDTLLPALRDLTS